MYQPGDDISISYMRAFAVFESTSQLRIFVQFDKPINGSSLSLNCSQIEMYFNGLDKTYNLSSLTVASIQLIAGRLQAFITINGTFDGAVVRQPGIAIFVGNSSLTVS